jgi:coenzyme F420-0:L-glutamate ligase / coenzyme F420-1:gamma-L-glutamate ligase
MELIGLATLPEVREGDDVARLVAEAAKREKVALRRGDVVVIAQKIVSKAEGRVVRLAGVKPSALARSIAEGAGSAKAPVKSDGRLIEVVLRESRRIVRMSERALIAETHHGFVCANAGVDQSNVKGDQAVCLPRDPDGSAAKIAKRLEKLTGARVAVIISDTFGRPWRLGLTNVAIGAAGFSVLEDLRGKRDAVGKTLHATILAVADDLAAAAGLLMGKAAKVPVVVVRGAKLRRGAEGARRLIRPAQEDMFR